MATMTKHLTSISPDMRSGPSPGRRLLALLLCAMLVVGSSFPGFAAAGEPDSEGEGTVPPVEVPAPPDFDPGGEETGLEEAPASEEGEAVEGELDVNAETPAAEALTGAATEADPPEAAEPLAPAEPEPVQQKAPEGAAPEPVANYSIVAPKQSPVERHVAHPGAATGEAAPPAEPAGEEAPPPPQPVAATAEGSLRNLAGEDFYVVRPGDCLWHIATALLPADAGSGEIAGEVQRLWQLNEDRIGTGDPSLIYAGTKLRLR